MCVFVQGDACIYRCVFMLAEVDLGYVPQSRAISWSNISQ